MASCVLVFVALATDYSGTLAKDGGADAQRTSIWPPRGEPGAELVAMPDTFMQFNRALIISLAGRYHLPTVYPFRVSQLARSIASLADIPVLRPRRP